VRENDNFDKAGLGFMEPVLPTSRTTQTENLELVILLRPRVVIYTAANDKRYIDFANKKHAVPGATKEDTGARVSPATDEFGNVYTPATQLNAVSASDTPPPAT